MPSGAKKRKSAKKTKQDSSLLTNGKPDESQAESEEILLNLVDPLEDNEEGPLTPKTPERDNESESKGRAGTQSDEWFKASDQDTGIPISQAETDFGSEENHLSSASISPVDRDISDRPDDSGNLPNSNVNSIREDSAANPRVLEYADGEHLGDRTELDSSLKDRSSGDCAASLSTECAVTEPFAETSGETLADLESEGKQGVLESEYADASRIEALAEDNLLTLGSQEETSHDALGKISTDFQGEYQQELSELDDGILTPPTIDSPVEFNSQEETSIRAVEAAEEPCAELELEEQRQLAGLDATPVLVPVDERHQNETSEASVEIIESGLQSRVAHLDTSPLTMPADESSVESKSQKETSTAAGEALRETGADLGLEGQQEIVGLDATLIQVPVDEDPVASSSQESTFTVAGEASGVTCEDYELSDCQEVAETDRAPIPGVTSENCVGSISQEETSAAAFEAAGELNTDLELDATSLSVSAAENAAERKSQEEMSEVAEVLRESSSDLELEGQQEAVMLNAAPPTLAPVESSIESTLQEETCAAMMKASEKASEGNELEVQQEIMDLEATPLTALTDESSLELTSAAAVEVPGETLPDVLEELQEVSEQHATPGTITTDESSVELKLEETSAGALKEAPGDSRADFESESQQDVSELAATSLLVPANESSVELESQGGEISEKAADVLGETSADPEFESQQDNLQLEATLRAFSTEESSVELKSQLQASATGMEGQRESNAILKMEGPLEVSEQDESRPFTEPSDESSLEVDSHETSVTAVECPEETSAQLGLEGELQVLEPDANPLTVPTIDSSGELESQDQTSATAVEAVGKTSADLQLNPQQVLELDDSSLTLSTNDSSVESKSQVETSATAMETPEEMSSYLEVDGQLEALEASAAALRAESKPHEDMPKTVVEAPGETGSDLEMDSQPELLGLDATPLTEPTGQSSGESKYQEETSATEVEASREINADLDLEGQLEISETDATPLAVFTDESTLQSRSQEETSVVAGEAPIDLDSELKGQQVVLELDVTALTVPTDETSVESMEVSVDESSSELISKEEVSPRAVEAEITVDSELEGQQVVSELDATPLTVAADESSEELKSPRETSAGEVSDLDVTPLTAPGDENSMELNTEEEVSAAPVEPLEVTSVDSEREGQQGVVELDGTPLTVNAEENWQELKSQKEMSTGTEEETGANFETLDQDEIMVVDDADGIQQGALAEESQVDQILKGQGESSSEVMQKETVDNFKLVGAQGLLGDSDAMQLALLPGVGQGKSQINEALRSQGKTSADRAEVAHSQEPVSPAMASEADGNDQHANFGEPERRDEAVNGTHNLQEQARQLGSKCVTVPGEQRLESSGMLADTKGGVGAEELLVIREEGVAWTRELDVGQESQPIVRQQIQKTKWWECCGVLDVLLTRS